MPRVLYFARTHPPLEPPFPLPPPKHSKPPFAATRQQHEIDLDDPNSPTSPLPDDPSHEEELYYYEYESEGECPPAPEKPCYDSERFRDLWEDSFPSCLLNVPEYANTALEHYNSQDKHQIKYQLIKAIVSSKIRSEGAYQRVNFTAKSTLENSKEEFFFAELRYDYDLHAWIPVCIVALEENERTGGFYDLLGSGGVDPRHCFGCEDIVKHPMDGSLYEAGHYLVDDCYFRRYIEVLPAITG